MDQEDQDELGKMSFQDLLDQFDEDIVLELVWDWAEGRRDFFLSSADEQMKERALDELVRELVADSLMFREMMFPERVFGLTVIEGGGGAEDD